MNKLMLKKILLISVIYFNIACQNDVPIVLTTIPKSGTHLMEKCVKSIVKIKKHISRYGLPTKKDFDSSDLYICHLRYNEYNKNCLYNLGKSIKFFIYRDPRDQLLSFIFWGNNYNELKNLNMGDREPLLNLEKIYSLEDSLNLSEKFGTSYHLYKDLYFDELVLQLIYGGRAYYDKLGEFYPSYKTKGIADFYSCYLGWKNLDDICAIRFEDLIGSKGGGSDLIQIKTIKKIALHLGKEISNQEAKQVARDLFGGTITFRAGQIGSWKKYFKEIHKKCFKEQAGQLLIDLGYEKDLNW